MQLYYLSNDKSEIAFIADTATNPAPVGLSSAAFAEMQYITAVKGQRSFWTLLDWVIADNRIKSIAVSLTTNVFSITNYHPDWNKPAPVQMKH